MSSNLTQRIKEHSVVLTDLDGLLVNAENFNQVFIQRIDPTWMTSTINRVVKSELHLRKLVQVLVKFVNFELHPQWTYHALAWLKHLFLSPSSPRFPLTPILLEACRPLLCYATESYGLQDLYTKAALRGTVMEKWSEKVSSRHGIPQSFFYGGLVGIPSTNYVYVDDSDEEFGEHRTRLPKRQKYVSQQDVNEEPESLSDHPESDVLSGSEADAQTSEQEDEDAFDETNYDSDHGVFDVNETGSSDEMHPTESSHRVADDDDWTTAHPVDSSLLFPNRTAKKDTNDEEEERSDEEPEETDEDSGESDDELDLLMWTNQHGDDSASSDSDMANLKTKQTSKMEKRKSSSLKSQTKSSPIKLSPKNRTSRTPKDDTPSSAVSERNLRKRTHPSS